jgi:hypothetical protein
MKVPRVFKLREAVLPALTSGQWCYKTPQFLHIDSGIYDCRLRNEKKIYFKCATNFTAHI